MKQFVCAIPAIAPTRVRKQYCCESVGLKWLEKLLSILERSSKSVPFVQKLKESVFPDWGFILDKGDKRKWIYSRKCAGCGRMQANDKLFFVKVKERAARDLMGTL